MRVPSWIGLFVVAASCSAGMQMSGGVSAQVTVGGSGGGGYAAMDELPVVGGELRLVAPQVMAFEGEQREMIAFPLRHTAITTKVGGMMAQYELEQTFENPFPEPIEAVYVFPLGADGAVSGYQITIGERTISGEIHTRDDARKIYETAKSEGHTAGLLEQNKPNIFTQHVANIAPHESVTVKITYAELLAYDNGAYDLVVPLVVGPRYLPADHVGSSPVGSHMSGGHGRPGVTSIPYVDATMASSTVSFTADIDAGVPIIGIESPSHDIVATPLAPTRSHVELGRTDEIPNRDLIIRYKTAGPQTTVGLLAHKTGEDGYFVLSIQPKATYRTGDITAREVMVVVDRSGSMDGAPLSQAKAVASGIIDSLTDRDTFNVIAFASGVEAMTAQPIRGDAAGKERGLDYLAAMQSGGGTEMEAGVQRMLTTDPGNDRIRVVYFLTDGFVGNDDVVVGAASKLLGTNRIFTIGVGSAPNRSLLDRLAQAGRGFASYLTLTEPAGPVAKNLVLKSAYPYMTDISIDWGGLVVDQMTPAPAIPDVFAGQPLILSGHYTRPGSATIKVSATTAGRRVTIPISVDLPAQSDLEPVASLWARRQIDVLSAPTEGGADNHKAIEHLGLAFHIVTEMTSFVAVDRTRIVSNGQVRVVEQPAIVPEGVNPATAVGGDENPPSYSSSSSSSSSHHHDSDSGFGGWGSGGPERSPRMLLVFAGLAAAWLTLRRRV